MLIYTNKNKTYCYIHIPKNSGKYVRNTILKNKGNKVLKNYWGMKNNLDIAHIPYMLKNTYIKSNIINNIIYYSYVRNPYDRIISAYFYKYSKKSINDFQQFVKTQLPYLLFDTSFNKDIIHFYPQYMFVCDSDLNVSQNVNIKKIEMQSIFKPKKYDLSIYFDNEMYNMINTIYKKDFEYFNYEMIE
jgi:hypothetical protein